jgi:two-component system, NtrC family, response regulator
MLLIIDDDIAVRTSLSLLLKQAGFLSLSASSTEEARKLIDENKFELIILDMNFSLSTTGEEGLTLLKDIKSITADTPVILITAWGSIPLAVEGMKLGAADFINKPWNNEYLLQSINTTLSLSKKNGDLIISHTREKLNKQFDFDNIIGNDPEYLKVLETIGRVSETDASVLIIGESGTGKELVAEAIHKNSRRKDNPFVKVNLGGISTSLFESEMFGHKKGSFTDAKEDRIGRFEAAEKGTIFLDEIGDLDLNSQVKLLRVLQDRSYEVLGSSKPRIANMRVISATNKDLKSMVEANLFREDLFYRINLITIKIPPLRERPADIPVLVNHFTNNLKTIYRRDELKISNSAIKWLAELPWPGNIRELKNLVERTILVTNKNLIDVEDFIEHLQKGPNKSAKNSLPAVGSLTLEEMEISMIKKALEFYEGNLSKVAKSLGLSRAALYRRLEKYGLLQ